MANFRYVFRYVLLGLSSATECSQVQPSAELTSQILPKTPKIPNTKGHVAVVRSIKTVAVEISNIKRLLDFIKTQNMHNSAFRYKLDTSMKKCK